MASSSIVSFGDLQRMRELASLSPDAASLQRKEQLKQQSQARYKNWNNTLEALRAKKEAERQKRLEDIEAAFAKIDAEEAAYQSEQRQKAIERADNIRYQQSEAARELHSSVLLTQVLKEREIQLERKKRQQDMQQRIEDGHLANQRKRMAKLEEREKTEQQKAKELSSSMATTQIEQLEAFQQKRIREMEEEFKEGERIRAQALADAKAAEEEALRKEQEKRRAAKAFQETNQQIQAEKRRLAELEKEEMDRLAAFHAEKLKQDDLRKQQAEEAFQKRMKTRGELLEQQMVLLKAERDKEEALLKQHIEEMGRRQEQKATSEAIRAKESDHQLHVSRQEQIKRRQAEAESARRAGQDLAEEFRKKNEEGLEQERMEREKHRQEALKLQGFLKQQMAERESIEKARIAAEVEAAESLVSKFATEDQKFERYAQALQDKLHITGKDAVPVQLAVTKLATKRR